MEEEIVKIKCSFCGIEIECPKDMLTAEKHFCFDCFNKLKDNIHHEDFNSGRFHVDIPKDKFPAFILDSAVGDVYPAVWNDYKQEIREMSKREIAEIMFKLGAETVLDYMVNLEEDIKKEKRTEQSSK